MDILVLPLLPDLRGGVAAQVIFDLLGVTLMDCCALGVLMRLQRSVTRSGGCVRLVAQAGPVLGLLKLTGTSDVLSTFDTIDRALYAPVPVGPHEGPQSMTGFGGGGVPEGRASSCSRRGWDAKLPRDPGFLRLRQARDGAHHVVDHSRDTGHRRRSAFHLEARPRLMIR